MKYSKTNNNLKEIERKFLVNFLPKNLNKYISNKIVQGYVNCDSKKEVRVRQKGDLYYQTKKVGGGKVRIEDEIKIQKEKFNLLWNKTKGKRIEKIRYEIPYKKYVIELDIYGGDLRGLIVAEVEFNSVKESDKFIPPNWFGEEVTHIDNYKNKNLALFGKPKEKFAKKYDLKNGILALTKKIKEKIKDKPVIVLVAGGSASGKTSTVAKKIVEKFKKDAVLISMDDYYKGSIFKKEEIAKGRKLNWDQPRALYIDKLKKHLSDLKNKKAIEKPVFDFKVGDPTSFEKINPKKIIVVEGLFALNPILKDEGDVKVFVDIGAHGRVMRKLLRDVERTNQTPKDLLKYFSETVEPMHEKYIQSTKQNADLVIKNEYNPKVESGRSNCHEVQLKFKGTLEQEFLRRIGAEKLASTIQTDNYYSPKNINFFKTNEILRIREESTDTSFTYKGPHIKSDYRNRPKFEFSIDNEIKNKFLSFYGEKVKVIKKERTLYQFKNFVFSLDKVKKIDKNGEKEIGNFVEFRVTNKNFNKNSFNNIISKLGFKLSDGIKKSYFELAK